MDDAKRRALIRSQSAKKKKSDDVAPMATVASNLSVKRKPPPKGDRSAKKPKVPLEPVVGLMAEGMKMVTPVKYGADKGLMKAPSTNQEKPPILLREDSKYALEQILSIISTDDYEDLGNHSTEAMGESGLFAVAQVIQPVTLMSVISICFPSNSLFAFAFLGNGYDERADRTVSQARRNPRACTDKGRVDGG